MSDIDGAQAPAESAPAPELPLDTPNPISTEAEGQPEPEKVEPDKPEPKAKVSSIDEALDKAAEKVAKAEKPEAKEAKTDKQVEAKQEVKTEVKRDETGKFASDKTKVEAKPSHTAGDPPARFTADVKAKWVELPDNVRGEISRMERELTQGYEKHKASAEAYEPLRQYADMAKQYGKDLHTVVGEYVNMENLLRADIVGGLDNICQRLGISLKDVAAHVMGQTPDQNASAQDATIRELRQTISALEQKVGTVVDTVHAQHVTSTKSEVEKFAAAPGHERFDELAEDIAFFLRTRTKDLSEAYSLAERLNPAPAASKTPAASSAPVIDLAAQTAKGSKSISGAPNAGSSPAAKRRSKSIDESLDRAFAGAG